MQLEALQDRLRFAHMQRLAASSAAPASAAAGSDRAAADDTEARGLRRQLEAAQQQNSALRATAARLSKALAAVMHRSAAGAGPGGPRPGSSASSRSRPSGAAGLADAQAASEVLAQLAAVEGALAGMCV